VADINVKFNPSSTVGVSLDNPSDIPVLLNPSSLISMNIPSDIVSLSYCAEFQAVYDSWTTKPESADATTWDTMVAALVDGGYWIRFDVFAFMAIHTNANGEALKWWNDPTKTMVEYNAPTFTAFEGFNSGALGYIDIDYNPFTDGVNYTQNKNSVAVYNRGNNQAAGWDIGGTDSTTYTNLACRWTNDNAYCKNNNNLQPSGANPDCLGLNINDRPDAGNNAIYRNNVQIVTQARAAAAIPDISFYLDSFNNNGVVYATRTNRQKAYAWIGDSFSTAERLDIQTICETALDEKSKGVIS